MTHLRCGLRAPSGWVIRNESGSGSAGDLDDPLRHEGRRHHQRDRDPDGRDEHRVDRRLEHAGRQVLEVGRRPTERSRTTELATAPNAATPTAVPTDRAKSDAPVATPRRSQPTDDCAAMIAGLAT